MARQASEPVASLAGRGCPPQLDQMIAYMMAKDPSQRYQQALQVAEALAYFVDPAALNVVPPVAPSLPAFDQWLQQQPRSAGNGAGAIPTALQMAAYTAAQNEAAQLAAQQMNAAPQTFSTADGYSAQSPGSSYDYQQAAGYGQQPAAERALRIVRRANSRSAGVCAGGDELAATRFERARPVGDPISGGDGRTLPEYERAILAAGAARRRNRSAAGKTLPRRSLAVGGPEST